MVGQVDDDDLVAAELLERVSDGHRFKSVAFQSLPGTWRASEIAERDLMPRSRLLAYLNPFEKKQDDDGSQAAEEKDVMRKDVVRVVSGRPRHIAKKPQRVVDRADVQLLLFGGCT